jgi:hypothetical protein
MAEFRPADHAMGLELQIEELIEQRERARVQDQLEVMTRLEAEISALQGELASTAELAVREVSLSDPGPEIHDAEKL